MSQNTQGHVMMPAGPRANLVITEAKLLFAFLEAGLNGPTHATNPGEGGQLGLCWSIAQIVFDFTGGWVVAQNKPYL